VIGFCVIAGFSSAGITNAQVVNGISFSVQKSVSKSAGNVTKAKSQVKTDMLKDNVAPAGKDQQRTDFTEKLGAGQQILLADGSAGDEPLLQKFIKKLNSILWG